MARAALNMPDNSNGINCPSIFVKLSSFHFLTQLKTISLSSIVTPKSFSSAVWAISCSVSSSVGRVYFVFGLYLPKCTVLHFAG